MKDLKNGGQETSNSGSNDDVTAAKLIENGSSASEAKALMSTIEQFKGDPLKMAKTIVSQNSGYNKLKDSNVTLIESFAKKDNSYLIDLAKNDIKTANTVATNLGTSLEKIIEEHNSKFIEKDEEGNISYKGEDMLNVLQSMQNKDLENAKTTQDLKDSEEERISNEKKTEDVKVAISSLITKSGDFGDTDVEEIYSLFNKFSKGNLELDEDDIQLYLDASLTKYTNDPSTTKQKQIVKKDSNNTGKPTNEKEFQAMLAKRKSQGFPQNEASINRLRSEYGITVS